MLAPYGLQTMCSVTTTAHNAARARSSLGVYDVGDAQLVRDVPTTTLLVNGTTFTPSDNSASACSPRITHVAHFQNAMQTTPQRQM